MSPRLASTMCVPRFPSGSATSSVSKAPSPFAATVSVRVSNVSYGSEIASVTLARGANSAPETVTASPAW